MKACLWLTLLSLFAVGYGATIAPKVELQKPAISKEDEAGLLAKAGKSLEDVGRLLQGDTAMTKEQQEELLQVFSALATGEGALSTEEAEYFWGLIVKGIVSGAASFGTKKLLEKLG